MLEELRPSSARAAQRAVFDIRSRSLAWRTTTSRNGAASRGIAGQRQNSGGKRQRGQRAGFACTGCPIYHGSGPRAAPAVPAPEWSPAAAPVTRPPMGAIVRLFSDFV